MNQTKMDSIVSSDNVGVKNIFLCQPGTAHPIYPEVNYNALAIGKIAKDTGGIAANLYFVPQQRLKFLEDWDEKYINKGNQINI